MKIGKVYTLPPSFRKRGGVNLIPLADEALTACAEREGLSDVDIINRALIVYDTITKDMADGKDVVIRSADGSTEKLVIQ